MPNNTTRINAIKLVQNSNIFYLCKLKKDTLIQISSTSMSNMGLESEIYQRRLDENRARKISKFINREDSVLPTAIILNSKQIISYDESTKTIELSLEPDSCFIVDGQHRIEGARLVNKDFEFVVVILEMLEVSKQTEIFVTINNEQKRVNPSVRFNLYANDKEKTPERVIRRIAYLLNIDNNSPFFGRIKMDDTKTSSNLATISLSAFSLPIVEFIYSSADYFELKDKLKQGQCFDTVKDDFREQHLNDYKERPLWDFYLMNEDAFLHKIIYNYFHAVSDVFYQQWNDKKSIIYKTTGYNALIMILKELLKIGKENKNFTYDFFKNKIISAKSIGQNLYVDYYGLGKIASYRLANDILYFLDSNNTNELSFLDFIIDED